MRAMSVYRCQACGFQVGKWYGRCPDCGEWNSLVEDAAGVVTPFSAKHDLRGGGRRIELVGLDVETKLPERLSTGIAELSNSPTYTARAANAAKPAM